MMDSKHRLLIVDDDRMILKALALTLTEAGYSVETADSGTSAVSILDARLFDLVITDLVMDEIDGIGVLKKAKEKNPETSVIILTGYGDLNSAVKALRLEADDYLLKPAEPEEIIVRVAKCLEKAELKSKLKMYEEMLAVCCVCKKIRDDSETEKGRGHWVSVEDFMYRHANLLPTSTYCPECAKRAAEEIDRMKLGKR